MHVPHEIFSLLGYFLFLTLHVSALPVSLAAFVPLADVSERKASRRRLGGEGGVHTSFAVYSVLRLVTTSLGRHHVVRIL